MNINFSIIAFVQDDAFTDVLNEMIDELSLGLCFEVHRNIKIGFHELQEKAEKWVTNRIRVVPGHSWI